MLARSRAARQRAGKEVAADEFPGRLVTVTDPGGAVSEAYRALRANLLYTPGLARAQVIVMTSPDPSEVKSVACANLGVVLAQAGKSTLVMDCDLRRPVLHEIFGSTNELGVANALIEDRSLQDIWQEPLPALALATAGPALGHPGDALGSERFVGLLDQARRLFDYVLVDTPPLRPVSDALTVAALGDGVLLVVDPRQTGKAAVRQTVGALRAIGADVLGTVAGNAEASRNDGRYQRYG